MLAVQNLNAHVTPARFCVVGAANIRKAGATDVRQLFPGDRDPDLASLYVVECDDQRRFQVLLSTTYPVRYVEEQVRRKNPAAPSKASPRRRR